MQYINKDLGSFNLHMINTDRFKTITISVLFHTPIIKEEITKRNILSDILLQSSKNYESKRSLTIKAEELYACDISTNNQRIGNYIFTGFNLQVLKDRYTEIDNLEKSIAFLSEIIYKPDVKNKKFNAEKLEIVRHNNQVAIDSMKESSSSYSVMKLKEVYDKNSPISYRMIGYQEDLDKIDVSNLYECYEKMIDNDYVDIFVVGDFNYKEMTLLIKKYFKFKKVKKRKSTYYLNNPLVHSRKVISKEEIDNTQSKLAIACPLIKLTDYEKKYPIVLANIILGGSPDSRLFKVVREENSLCYTVRSQVNRFDNLLLIMAGIDRENYSKTLDVTTKTLQNLKKGHFTDQDINNAKEYYNTSLEEIESRPGSIISEYLYNAVLGGDVWEERIKKMNKVTKRQIIKAAKKIKIDTVFLLEGVKHEED